MINADDIATAVVARTGAVSAFASAVPGGAWFDRGPDTPSSPVYAVFRLRAGEARVFSGAAYVQPWEVEFGVYAPVGAPGVNPQAVQQALAACFTTTAGQAPMKGTAMRNATERVLHSRPLAASGEMARELREGRDVLLTGIRFELLVQGDRSAS